MEPSHPPIPARRTQWLASVLAHHYGLDLGLDNEIIVLSGGLDQYLQEVFHHLDWRGEGSISGEEFRTLCRVLDLEPGMDECEGLLEHLPERLTFRHFHSRLCGYFSSKAGGHRLPSRRENQSRPNRTRNPGMSLTREEEEITRLEDENHKLREMLEDMRAALQSSDARCLALQVGLRKNLVSQNVDGNSSISSRRVLSESYTVTTRCVQREVNLIRNSRDDQLEELIKMNKDLEEELSKTQNILVYLEEGNQRLIKEQAETRKRAEDARRALLACYGKVKDLEIKSNEVPLLQRRVDQLETELQHYRSEGKPSLGTQEQKILSMSPNPTVRKAEKTLFTEDMDSIHNTDDQLFRSVEGQAASDEEEERWIGETAAEMRQILTNVSCCASGCEDRRIRKFLWDIRSDGTNHKNMLFLWVKKVARMTEELEFKEQEIKDLEILIEEMKVPFTEELERKVEEIELQRIDLQMLETERVRLSLIEEKLLDVLQLLQQLRDQEISHQELGRVLLNTLEICREPQQGKEHIYEVLDTLRHELSVCERLQSQNKKKDNKTPSLASSLVISC